MFESGAKIEKEPLVCFKAAPAVNTTSATAEDIATSQYLLVIFVITIVVVSTLYFSAALIVELSRSCSHFLKVHRSREKDKKEDAKESEGTLGGDFENANPMHRMRRSSSVPAMPSVRLQGFNSEGSVDSNNPFHRSVSSNNSSSGTLRSLQREVVKPAERSESKLSVDVASMSHFKASGVSKLVTSQNAKNRVS